jgi:hypothetical protein
MLNVGDRMSRVRAILLPALLAFAACGGGGNAKNPGTGGTGVGVGTAGTTGSGTPGAAGTTGTPGAAGTTGAAAGSVGTGAAGTAPVATVAACDTYCTAITAACTGANAQYTDKANCMKVCGTLPGGTPTDATGNTVGCRTNAAKDAALDTMAVKNSCWFAGPFGLGRCGSECDIFCPIAMSYCGAAAAYTSLEDCMTDCGGWGHQPDPTMPGIYAANYTPGTTPETKDTSDCRAYHLFINAMGSAAGAQATHCPHVANNSSTCGPGYTPPPMSDAGTTVPDGGVPVYDGGLVNIINSTTWSETKYPPAMRKMLLRDEGDPHLVMIDLSKTPILQWKQVAGGPWARAAQLIGNNQILGGTNDGYEVFDYTTGMIAKKVTGFGGTQSAYRMATGETMLTTSGTVLKFLDKTDKVAHQISYPGYGYVRVARPTRNGTFLVPSDNTVFEGDAKGTVLWKLSGGAPGWGHIWEPILLGPPVGGGKWSDGDTLICTAFGSSCDVIDKVMHKVTFRFGTKAMPMAATFSPNFFSEFEILPNGNLFCSNWQGHGGGNGSHGIQVIEFDPTGAVVWFWKQDPTIFSSIQGVQNMDASKDPKYLHVQETSPNSTWQPVIPTP